MAPHVAVQRFPVRLSSGTFSTYLRQQVCSWTRNSFCFLTEQINIPEVKSDFASDAVQDGHGLRLLQLTAIKIETKTS